MSDTEEDTYYPLLNDINFNYKLQKHPQFNKFFNVNDRYILEEMMKKTDEKCNSTGGYIFKKIQLFVSSFLSLNTPYNGLLLYHGVGVGKSCSSILIADNFRNYVKKHNKKIIILTKKTIKDGFRKEIFNSENMINKIDKNQFTCTSNQYIEEWNKFISVNPNYNEKDLKKFDSEIIDKYYEIYSYLEFTNKYEDIIKKPNGEYNCEKINELFSNCILIIDEIHNLREEVKKGKKDKVSEENDENKRSRTIIQNIIENLHNSIKLILLSATPMYDKYNELEFIINLLLRNDNKEKIHIDDLTNYVNNPDNMELKNNLIQKTRGYISFIKGNDPHIFPLVLYPENNSKLQYQVEDGYITNNKINAVLCLMSDFQKDIYKKKTKDMDKKKISNISFPENTKFNDIFTKNTSNKKYNFKTESLAIELLDNISKYSTKIYNLLENLNNSSGKSFIYSQYLEEDYGGTGLLSIFLEYNGYIKKKLEKSLLTTNSVLEPSLKKDSSQFKGYFIVVDGKTTEEDFIKYKTFFNSNDNINGDIIKIIIGTTNMIEGVSLYNVRQIHIIHPWYNVSRNEQIVGRGVRQCSHINLPFEKRNVTIFNYIAISEKLEKDTDNSYIVNQNNLDHDLRTLFLATEKIKNISIIEDLLKSNSIDCLLNKNINNLSIIENKSDDTIDIIEYKDSFDNTRLISYFISDDITCISNEITIDKNTEDYYKHHANIFINEKLIQNIKYFIKTIFTKGIYHKDREIIENKIYFSFNELYDELKLYDSEIDENLFKLALQDLILNKETFYNKFNIEGYIILKGVYFIFKRKEFENIYIPLEYNHPFNNNIKNIYNFNEYQLELDFKKPATTYVSPIILKPHIVEQSTDKLSDKSTEQSTDKLSDKSTEQSTDKSSDKLTEQSTDKSSDKSPNTPIKSSKLSNKDIIDKLLSECYNNGMFPSLYKDDINNIYKDLWNNKLKAKTGNKVDGLIYYNSKNLERIKEENKYKSIFTIIFESKIKYDNNANKKLDEYYDLYHIIPFIFNYSDIILVQLKCLFYRKHIKKEELPKYENMIYNHYKNLIIEEDPLVFKYVEYSRDSLFNYNYEDIILVSYRFDNDTNTWVYQKESVSILNSDKNKKTTNLSDHINIKGILSIDDIQFNRIIDTFKLNNYNNYYKYNGNIDNPFSKERKKNIKTKMNNIIGYINFTDSDSIRNLHKLSRNTFTLGIIYSDSNNTYFKKSITTTFDLLNELKSEKKTPKSIIQMKHIIYCIIDQVELLNRRLLLEFIFNEKIDDIKNLNNFYELLLDFDFNNPTIDETIYDKFKSMIKFEIKSIEEINKIIQSKQKYFYLDFKLLDNILQHKLTKSSYIILLTYLLYDLDNYYVSEEYTSFYNKRWMFSMLESSFLSMPLIKSKFNTLQYETASVTKYTFIKSKLIPIKTIKKYKETDT